MVQFQLKQVLFTVGLILSTTVTYSQGLPRIRFSQIQKDTFAGSVLVSGQDSSLSYSRDLYLSDNQLRLYTDTIPTKRYLDSIDNLKLNTSFSNVTGTLPVANGGTGVSSLTANKVLVGNGTSAVLTPTNLHWDNTNSRLGIGITAPRVALEVNADQIIDASNVWTARTSAADNNWLSVTYGNGLFVAVSQSGTGNRVMTSPDGITWTARTSAADNNWYSVTYGNGLFVAVAESGSGNRVMTSPDGITWTARTSAADNSWRSVTYGNGLFVAVAQSGSGNRVMTSPDGITWTARTSAADNSWRSVTYGNGLFVAVAQSGSGNRVMTSPDGITWTARTSAADNNWLSVTYGNGLFVAVARTGTGNRVMTSPDGITWTARTSTADIEWHSVTYGNGLFVAVAITGSGDRVMTSPDGITWTARTSAADNFWHSVTYGNGLFVAVAFSGTGNRVMTSGKQYKQDLAHNNIWQGNQYMPFVYNQTTAEAANMYIDTTTGELKRSTSSIRYKTNVELYQKGLNDLLNLTPVTFKGINDGNKTFAGFIAEELDENGLTEFVQYDAQGKPDAIRYNQMVTILTKSIQELFAIIEELQVKIQILENK
jgi:predicted RecA/RadA family phage recombinase